MRRCNVCKKKTAKSTYCSDECRKIGFTTVMKNKNIVKNCKMCGDTFHAVNSGQVYCTNDCCILFTKIKRNELRPTNFNIFRRDNFKCIYCGMSSIEDGVKLHIDHLKPLFSDGLADINNLVTACEKCNLSKSSIKLPDCDLQRILVKVKERNDSLLKSQLDEIILEANFVKYQDFYRRKKQIKF